MNKNDAYVNLIEEFYSTQSVNRISSNAMSVYFALLHIAYKTDWISTFTVPNITLMCEASIDNAKTLQRCRNELATKGYIKYFKGTNQNTAPKYQISAMVKNNQPNDLANDLANVPADDHIKDKTRLDRLDKTRLDLLFNYLINKEEAENFESLTQNDKTIIKVYLERLNINIETPDILNLIKPEQILDYEIQYWVVTQLSIGEYKIFLNYLSAEKFSYLYLKSKRIIKNYVSESDNTYITRLASYFIKTLENEFMEELNKNENGYKRNMQQKKTSSI